MTTPTKPQTSCEGTKYMLNIVEGHLGRQEARLAKLVACTELDVEIPYGKSEKVGAGRHVQYVKQTMTVTLKATDIHTSEYGNFEATDYKLPDGTEGWKVFSEERKSQVYQTERRIEGIKHDIAFFQKKIADWKP